MVRPLSKSEGLFSRARHGQFGEPFFMPAPEPEDLRALGRNIDEARGGETRSRSGGGAPTAAGIAFRFATELVVAIGFCTGLGWLLDHWLHTAPIFIVIMFVLGAAAGIRNVMRAAAELNAEAAKYPAPAVKDDEE
jgi:ATP synthase protein I